MANDKQIQTTPTASRLERFSLGFEYNKTIQEVKREVRLRTYKDA